MKYSFTILLAIISLLSNAQFNSFNRYNYYNPIINIHEMHIKYIETKLFNSPIPGMVNSEHEEVKYTDDIVFNNTIYLPLKKFAITSKYGIRFHPVYARQLLHNGIDLAVNYDTIFASFTGIITSVSFDERSGIYIKLTSGNFIAGYAHLSRSFVLPDAHVFSGQAIGISGSTGAATGPHLHFSLKYKDQWIDPLPFLYLAMKL